MKQALFMEAEYVDDVLVIRPMGTFNCWQLPTIKAIIGTYLHSTTKPQIIINLKHVRFVDTPTFAQLYNWLTIARRYHGDVKLCAVSQTVHNLMFAQDLDLMFDIHAEETFAMTSFTQGIFPHTA